MNEEIVFKMGVDNRPLQRGLRTMKSMVGDAAKGIAGMFAGAFGIGFLVNQFNQLRNAVEDIRRVSDSTGLDIGLVQDLQNAAVASGVAKDAVESMLDTFAKKLEPGSDPEEALSRLVNHLRDIQDPGEKARLAV